MNESHRLGIDFVDAILAKLTLNTRLGKVIWEPAGKRLARIQEDNSIAIRHGEWMRTVVYPTMLRSAPFYSLDIRATPRAAEIEIWLCEGNGSVDTCLGHIRCAEADRYRYQMIKLLHRLATSGPEWPDTVIEKMYRDITGALEL